jgi:hypothetical protein
MNSEIIGVAAAFVASMKEAMRITLGRFLKMDGIRCLGLMMEKREIHRFPMGDFCLITLRKTRRREDASYPIMG